MLSDQICIHSTVFQNFIPPDFKFYFLDFSFFGFIGFLVFECNELSNFLFCYRYGCFDFLYFQYFVFIDF